MYLGVNTKLIKLYIFCLGNLVISNISSHNVEYTTNKKGNLLLSVDGYHYAKKISTKTKIYW